MLGGPPPLIPGMYGDVPVWRALLMWLFLDIAPPGPDDEDDKDDGSGWAELEDLDDLESLDDLDARGGSHRDVRDFGK